MSTRDWKALVSRHAAGTGAGNLPLQTVDELAAHLEACTWTPAPRVCPITRHSAGPTQR